MIKIGCLVVAHFHMTMFRMNKSHCCLRRRCKLRRRSLSLSQDRLLYPRLKECGHVWLRPPPNMIGVIQSQIHPQCVMGLFPPVGCPLVIRWLRTDIKSRWKQGLNVTELALLFKNYHFLASSLLCLASCIIVLWIVWDSMCRKLADAY